jgi:hypothetical protein
MQVSNFGYVYIVDCLGYTKIGAAHDVKRRIFALQAGNPFKLEIIHSFYHRSYIEAEAALHRSFKDFRIDREWFKLDFKQKRWLAEIRDDTHIDQLNQWNRTY